RDAGQTYASISSLRPPRALRLEPASRKEGPAAGVKLLTGLRLLTAVRLSANREERSKMFEPCSLLAALACGVAILAIGFALGPIDEIFALFADRGETAYFGEPVSQAEH